MKTLKSVLFTGLGLAGVATVAGITLAPSAAISRHQQNAATEVVSISEHSNSQQTLIARAPNNNALAASLQGRPTVVKIYADWCPACQRLRPTTQALQQQFNGRANFIIFDVSDRGSTREAEARARQLGLTDFLNRHRTQTSTVAIINPSNGQIFSQFRYNFDQQDYVNAINRAISRVSQS